MTNEESNHINLLSIFHFVLAGITGLFSCIFIFHLVIGIAMISGSFVDAKSGPPPAVIGWLFAVMGSLAIAIGWCLAICMLLAGLKLRKRKNRLFCMIVAGLECMIMPFGTILGALTLFVLNKESVKADFLQSCEQTQS